MPKLQINRTVHIKAPAQKVYDIVSDFHQWPAWSPWLIMEPKAKVEVQKDGKYYSWDGDRVGSGNMKVLKENAPKEINYDLHFIKPFKSNPKVDFKIRPEGDSCYVSWTMDSSLPFFLFFMKKSMSAFISHDYDRGLNMLKDLAETGKVNSKLEIKDPEQFAGTQYVGVRRKIKISDIKKTMGEDFGKIFQFMGDHTDQIAGDAMSIYHKWDMVNGDAEYTAAIPVKNLKEVPAGFISGSIPACKVRSIMHTGAYEHLGNAWSTLYTMQRSKEFKAIKGQHPFEVYRNNPENTPAEQLKTEVMFPIQ